ncbi:Tex1 [Kluyveromyces lactis]|nr:Tex1 [Kluyveromyces lactis]
MSRFGYTASKAFEITCLNETGLKSHYSSLLESCCKDKRVLKDYHATAVKDSRSVRTSLNEIIALDSHSASKYVSWSRIDGSLTVMRPPLTSDRSQDHVLIGSIKKDVHGEGKIVYSISWNPNELQFASVGNTPTVKIWNVVDDKLSVLKEFKTNYKAKNFITEYDPSGKYLVVVTKTNEIYIYNAESGYESCISFSPDEESDDAIHSLCWSNDSKHIIVAYKSGFIKLFSLQDDGLKFLCERRNDMKTITSLIMDPLGRALLVGTHNECSIYSLLDLVPLKKSIKTDNRITGIDVSFDGSIISILSKALDSHDSYLSLYWYNDFSILYNTVVKNSSRSTIKWSKSCLIFYTTGALDKMTMVDLRSGRPKTTVSTDDRKRNDSVKKSIDRSSRTHRDTPQRGKRDKEPRKQPYKRDTDKFSEKSFGRSNTGSSFRKPNDRW